MTYDCLICNCQITAWLPANLCENIDYNLWQYNLQSEKSEKLRSSKSGNCSQWTVIKITTIHSTDNNQITMGIWTRWNIVIITTDIFAVCQYSPFGQFMRWIGLIFRNWQYCLAGRSKMPQRILIFSIVMGANNSFELISIETYAPQFLGHNKIFLGSLAQDCMITFMARWLIWCSIRSFCQH